MPSKSYLMQNFSGAKEILEYAAGNHGVCSVLKFIKHESSGQVRVQACLESNHNTTFEGIGADKKEALADCISGQFPG